MSLADPRTIGLTPQGRQAELYGNLRGRTAVLERRSIGVGGGSQTFSDTPNIEFDVSGTVTADIPPTAAPTLARVGLGRAPSATSPLRVGDSSATYMEVFADSGLKRIDIYRTIQMFGNAAQMGTNLILNAGVVLDPDYPVSPFISTGATRVAMNIACAAGAGTNGLRYRQAGNVRTATANSTALQGKGTDFISAVALASDSIAWRLTTTQTDSTTFASVPVAIGAATLATPETIAPGTLSLVAGSTAVVGVGTDFRNQLQANDVVSTPLQNVTVASVTDATHFTTTAATTPASNEPGSIYYVPWSLNDDLMYGENSTNYWGGMGGTAWRGIVSAMHQKGKSSMEFLSMEGQIHDAAGGGTDAYGELSGCTVRLVGDRKGAFMGSEFGAEIRAGKQTRSKNIGLNISEANAYSTYNALPFVGTSSWRQTGSRGLWVNSSSAGQVGTCMWITNRIGTSTFKRVFVINQGWAEDFYPGTDVFCIDGDGRIAITPPGSVDGITCNQATTLDAAVINLPGGSTLTANGIRWGSDANSCNLFRNGPDSLRTDDTLFVGGNLNSFGPVAVIGGTSSTGYVSYTAIASGSPPGAATTARVFCDLDGSSNERMRVQLGTGEIRTLAKKGGLDDFAVGATTALGGADAGIFFSSGGEINSVKGSGYIFKNYAAAGHAEPRYAVTFSGEHRLGPGGSTAVDVGFARDAAGSLSITDGSTSGTGVLKAKTYWLMGTAGAGYISWLEQSSAPGTPPATRARQFLEDDGTGKQRLRTKWDDGTVSTIVKQGATNPAYTTTGVTPDRALSAPATIGTVELGHVLGALIQDLQAHGILT